MSGEPVMVKVAGLLDALELLRAAAARAALQRELELQAYQAEVEGCVRDLRRAANGKPMGVRR